MGNARQAAAVIVDDDCDRRNELKAIIVPTVVIHGEVGLVVNIAAGKELAEAVPNAKYISIPGMGYDLPLALVPQFRDAILIVTEGKKP